jgi:hypothetical protein
LLQCRNDAHRILLAICALGCFRQVILLFTDSMDQAYGSTLPLHLSTLAITAGVTWLGYQLGRHGKTVAANILLALVAAPTIFYGVFILALMEAGGWR